VIPGWAGFCGIITEKLLKERVVMDGRIQIAFVIRSLGLYWNHPESGKTSVSTRPKVATIEIFSCCSPLAGMIEWLCWFTNEMAIRETCLCLKTGMKGSNSISF
jgi:hypothetical protein